MNIISVHATYKKMSLRELESWTALDQSYLEQFLTNAGVNEFVILRTCNRMEIYMNTDSQNISDAIFRLVDNVTNVFVLSGVNSIKHLMRVCSGLDSMVLGEQEIQRQVKDALNYATRKKTSGKVLNYIFMKALSTGKEIREKTKIANGIISIPQSAIKMLQNRIIPMQIKKLCVVGTGRVARTVVKYLSEMKNKFNLHITVCGRTPSKLKFFATNYSVSTIHFNNLIIQDYDCIISAVTAPTPIIKLNTVQNTPALIIDLGNPRNIETVSNKNYIDLDMLKNFVNQNLEIRKREISKAEKIIEKNVQIVVKKLNIMEIDDLVSALYKYAEHVRKEEVAETLKVIGDANKEVIESLTKSLVNKLLARPVTRIKKMFNDGTLTDIKLLKQMYGVSEYVSKNENEKIKRK